ncbi:metallo proteinase 10 [Crucibulum laeve]|uniref:Extracellular metalloproteinase n=1 Tax=Crucibulum laeve TaxID=68775 RepID=A0A5C3LJ06_9AGAR|nr:metallo proteinase 10 [Crucibulum laeve]
MVSSNNFFSLFLVLLLARFTEAAPWPAYVKHSTHRVRNIGRGLAVEAYHPKTTFNTYGSNGRNTSSLGGNSFASKSWNETALAFLGSELGINSTGMGYKSGWATDTGKYAFIKEYHNGIPFANAVANIALDQDNNVVSFGSSFVDVSIAKIAPSTPSITWKSVLPQIEESLDGTFNGQEPTLEYLVKADGSVALTHVVQVQNNETNAWYEAYICAHSGELVSVTDFVAHATYTVLPIDKQAFSDGIETLVDPEDPISSPNGWHLANSNTATTSGNNAQSFKLRAGRAGAVPQSAAGPTFDYTYDDTLAPTVQTNINAAVTNAFYIINTMHDFTYRYGFTEKAFNFQVDNNGKGGRAGDPVLVSVQDPSGTNNANFATPPDGQSGTCRMFIWTLTNPNRDGAMENSIIIHEMTHGITNRLTGGGTGRCLQTLESGGLGEGWGDTMAEWLALKTDVVDDFIMGQYVLGSRKGIRSFPYSTNPAKNPLRYSSLQQFTEVHEIGEVWATMLHVVLAALVEGRGFSKDALTNPDGLEGNIVFMRLFMTSLALQPCNPTFVQARDAWIQADENLYLGANKCTLFTAFASRGLGLNAANFRDDDTVPAGC